MSKSDTPSSAPNMEFVCAEDGNDLENSMEILAYKKMYSKMFNATTDAMEKIQEAVDILCKAQLHCEQTFMEAPGTSLSCNSGSTE